MPVMFGAVGAPSNVSASDSANLAALQGKAGELIDSNLHGKWYTAAYRNRVFVGSSLIAGVTIPVNTTTAPTFTLFNPLGSGVNLELVSFDMYSLGGTMVVGTILGGLSTQTPTAVTAGGATISVPVGGGGVAQAKLYTAATIVAITTHFYLGQVAATTSASVHYEFDGKIIIAPGGLITVYSNPVQTAVTVPSFVWAEWPI